MIDLGTKTTEMDTAHLLAVNARQTAQSLTTAADVKERAWDTAYNNMVSMVDAKAPSEAAKINAGFDLVADRTPVGILPAPQALAVTMSEAPGSLTAQWDAMPKASSFMVEIATNVAGPFTLALTPTGSDCVLTGLVSGTTYYVRVKAVSSAGVSAPSDIAVKMAP